MQIGFATQQHQRRIYMKKFLFSAMIAVSSLIGFSSAHASDAMNMVVGPEAYVPRAMVYTCQLRGRIHGESVAVIIGGENLKGTGYLTCENNVTGKRIRVPIAMSLVGGGIGFDFTIIRGIRIFSAGFGIDDPSQFMGTFGLGITGGATLGRAGLGFDVAFEIKNRAGLDVELGLQGENARGLGAHLYGMEFRVSRR
jgi:hypothetical protein